MELGIGVDIGATNIRIAIGNSKGKIILKSVERTTQEGNEYSISSQIVRIIKEFPKELLQKVSRIVIGSAGPLDIYKGCIYPANLPFKVAYLVEPVSRELGLRATLLNDAVVAVLGEKYFGQGKKVDNMVYVTISSGIGVGVFVDRHVLLGKDGNAHEFGHTTIDLEGRLLCGCGKRGHWEAYCSGNNIPNYAGLLSNQVDNIITYKSSILHGKLGQVKSKEIFDAARNGDSFALTVVRNVGRLNAIGFANLINVYDPEIIVVGGAVATNNKDLILNPIIEQVKDHAINRIPPITLTSLGDDIGLLGAIAAVFH